MSLVRVVAAFNGGACAVEESGNVECGVDEDGFAHCFDAVRESSGDDPLLYPPDVPLHGIAGTAQTNCALTEEGRIVCWGYPCEGLDAPP